jgi:ATP-binding cassette subfamily B (MDR/TAP) protein 1
MTFVVGKAFDAFAQYQTSFSKHELLKGVGIASLELVALAVASLALGSLTSFLWIWTGEVNVLALRKRVYQAVTNKEIVWFDLNMGTADDSQDSIGAGGLMAKFSRFVFWQSFTNQFLKYFSIQRYR